MIYAQAYQLAKQRQNDSIRKRDELIKSLPYRQALREKQKEMEKPYADEYSRIVSNLFDLVEEINKRQGEPPENDRNTMIIEKPTVPWFAAKRGETILEYFSHDDTYREVVVKSISHAKDEINGRDKNFFYPLDYPVDSSKLVRIAESEENQTPLSDVIDQVNQENGLEDGFTEEDRVASQTDDDQAVTNFDDMKAFLQKIRDGEASAVDLQQHAKSVMENRDQLEQDIYDRMANDPRFKRKRKKTRSEIAQRTVDSHIRNLIYSVRDSYTWQPFDDRSEEEQLLDIINTITDEEIQEKAQERTAEREQRQKAINNPETLDEFELKISRVGRDQLTPEEEKRYQQLVEEREEEIAAEKRENQKQKPSSLPRSTGTPIASSDRFTIEEDTHTKTGEKIWVAKLKNRVDRDEFQQIKAEIEGKGGYYSRYKRGFIFSEDPTNKLNGESLEASDETSSDSPVQTIKSKQVSKLRKQADTLQKRIDERRSDRLTNTARRAAIAAYAEKEADQFERLQKIIRSIADAIESEETTHLSNIQTKAHVEQLISEAYYIKDKADEDIPYTESKYENIRERDLTVDDIRNAKIPIFGTRPDRVIDLTRRLEDVNGAKQAAARVRKFVERERKGDQMIDLLPVREYVEKLISIGKQMDQSKDEAERLNELLMRRKRLEAMGITDDIMYRAAMREFMSHYNGQGKSEEEKRKARIKQRQSEVARSNIAGYFPTPRPVVDQMIMEADIEPGMKVLEPSAGAGHIADALREAGADVDVVEFNSSLYELLEEKGYDPVAMDFMEFNPGEEYDRIVMNPPFEKGQDIDHVRHAFELLKPGGTLVAIMSEGPFFRSDRKSKEWREFLDEYGYSEQLPEGTFKESDRQTGVNTRMVVLTKPIARQQLA